VAAALRAAGHETLTLASAAADRHVYLQAARPRTAPRRRLAGAAGRLAPAARRRPGLRPRAGRSPTGSPPWPCTATPCRWSSRCGRTCRTRRWRPSC
jgi:hypothetical protein